MKSIFKTPFPFLVLFAGISLGASPRYAEAADPSSSQIHLIASGAQINENTPVISLALGLADLILAPRTESKAPRVSDQDYINDESNDICIPVNSDADEYAAAVGGGVCLSDGAISDPRNVTPRARSSR